MGRRSLLTIRGCKGAKLTLVLTFRLKPNGFLQIHFFLFGVNYRTLCWYFDEHTIILNGIHIFSKLSFLSLSGALSFYGFILFFILRRFIPLHTYLTFLCIDVSIDSSISAK